jgi:hypothetical protein
MDAWRRQKVAGAEGASGNFYLDILSVPLLEAETGSTEHKRRVGHLDQKAKDEPGATPQAGASEVRLLSIPRRVKSTKRRESILITLFGAASKHNRHLSFVGQPRLWPLKAMKGD